MVAPTQGSESSSPKAPEKTQEQIRQEQLIELLGKFVEMHPEFTRIATMLSDTLENVVVESSEVFPGWKPRKNRPNDAWVLLKAELWVGDEKIPICSLHQSFPNIVTYASKPAAPNTVEDVMDAIFKTPLHAALQNAIEARLPSSGNHRLQS